MPAAFLCLEKGEKKRNPKGSAALLNRLAVRAARGIGVRDSCVSAQKTAEGADESGFAVLESVAD